MIRIKTKSNRFVSVSFLTFLDNVIKSVHNFMDEGRERLTDTQQCIHNLLQRGELFIRACFGHKAVAAYFDKLS